MATQPQAGEYTTEDLERFSVHKSRILLTATIPVGEKNWQVDVGFPHKVDTVADIANCDEGTASFLEGIVKMLKPQTILEVGTHKGRSTKALSEGVLANGTGHIWTIDRKDYDCLNMALDEQQRFVVTSIIGKTPEVYKENPF